MREVLGFALELTPWTWILEAQALIAK